MDKERIKNALEALKKEKKRNFSQSFDLLINLKDLDIKSNPLDLFVQLPYNRGKKAKICALVGPELAEKAKICDLAIKEFNAFQNNKKAIKQLAKEHDFFIAQTNIMPAIATVFGKVLGPLGKMPNPKADCVVPPTADLKSLVEKLQKLVRLQTKKEFSIKVYVGKENQIEEEIVENILSVYTSLIKNLPTGESNIKNVFLKLTMSKPVKI